MTKTEIKGELKYIDHLIKRIGKENFKLSTKIKLIREQEDRKIKLLEQLNE